MQDIAREIKTLGLSFLEWLKIAKSRALNLGDSNRNLALDFIARGQFREAIFRLKMALRFSPQDAEIWYMLGRCYQMTGEKTEAKMALKRSIAIHSKHEEARFLLAILDPSIPADLLPHTYPVSLVKEYFGSTALSYDETQINSLDYKSHEETISLVRYYLPAPDNSLIVADIGCGTGLMGKYLRPYASDLRGVDVCKEMADLAFLVGGAGDTIIYDDMVIEDARDYLLRRINPTIDLITASYVVNYMGGLSAVFDGAKKALKPGGWFIFTTDTHEGSGYQLHTDLQRFAHSESYIEEQIKRVGFTLHTIQPITVYDGVDSLGVVCQKPL